MLRKLHFPFLGILMVVGLGVVALIFGTARGIGVGPDSVTYIGMARILAGVNQTSSSGLTTQYPPFYPALLALMSHLHSNLVTDARWLAVLLFALNTILFGWMLSYLLPHSTWMPVLGVALYVLSDGMLMLVQGYALSEGPFLFFGFLGIFGLAFALDKQRRGALIASAVSIALACLTRYAGVTLLVASAATILLVHYTNRKMQIIDLCVFLLIGTLPLAAWLLYAKLVNGRIGNRLFEFHPVPVAKLQQGLTNIAKYLLPDRAIIALGAATPILVLVGLLIVAVFIFWMARREQGKFVERYFRTLSTLKILLRVFILIYAVFILFSISFLDYATPLDRRIFTPVFTAALVLMCCAVAYFWRQRTVTAVVRTAMALGGLIFLTTLVPRTLIDVVSAHNEGQGYMSRVWQDSPLIAAIRALPADTFIFTNGGDVISFLTGRQAYSLPNKLGSDSVQANPDYNAEFSAMVDTLSRSHGIIAYFNLIGRSYLPDKDELQKSLPLHNDLTTSDGVLYTLAPSP